MSLERVRQLRDIRNKLADFNEWSSQTPVMRFFRVRGRTDHSEGTPSEDGMRLINDAVNEVVRYNGDIVRSGSDDIGQFVRQMTLNYIDRLIVQESKASKKEAEEVLRDLSSVAKIVTGLHQS